ncbi:hypothetical protein TrST_g7059 [Triparma strigata]|uniref:Uncharacterized protein n=1 Tax=Triparma strigata TaxID=1606541 RepID=A0A9W7C5S8_9STRA|nr:hypothetical protein TrST_g7059 [Triparma strigata]
MLMSFVGDLLPRSRRFAINSLQVSVDASLATISPPPLPSLATLSTPPTPTIEQPTPTLKPYIRRRRRKRQAFDSVMHQQLSAPQSAPQPVGELNPESKRIDLEQFKQQRYGEQLEGRTWRLFDMLSRSRSDSGKGATLLSPNDMDRLEASSMSKSSSGVPGSILHSDGRSTVDEEDDDSIFSLEEIGDGVQLFEQNVPDSADDEMDEMMKRAMMVGNREYEGTYHHLPQSNISDY